jgi:hypothetical protein
MNATNGKGGGLRNNYKPKQNRMLENYVCNDRIRNDDVANMFLSLNRKNTLDNSCNDKEDNNSVRENKGDKNEQFHANLNMSAHELGKGNVCLDAWSTNLITNKDCKANRDNKMDCNDDCNSGLDYKNKKVQKCPWKKVEVRHKKYGKGSGLFAMEDIDKDDYVIEYVGKIEYNRIENNYMLKLTE